MSDEPNWYPDPGNATQLRWWDGQRWTEYVQPLPLPTPPIVALKQSKQGKVVGITLSIIAIVLVGLIVGGWLLISSIFDLNNRLSDEDVERIQSAVSNESGSLEVLVYTSGTSCEQLCQELYVNVTLPDESAYSATDLKNLIRTTSTELDSLRKEKEAAFCFDFTESSFKPDDGNVISEEDYLYSQLAEITLPKEGYADDESPYKWTRYTCLMLSPEEMAAAGA